MLNENTQRKYIKFCHIFGICTQSTNPLFCFADYFLSLYFSLKNAMVYIKKIKVKTTLVYVFQNYMVNFEKLLQQVISSSIYTSLFLNSDLYVHSIMWEKFQAGILLFGRLPIFMVDEYFSNNRCSVWVFLWYRHLFYKSVNTFIEDCEYF